MRKLAVTGLLLAFQVFSFAQTDREFWFVAPAVTFKTIPPSPRNDSLLNRPIRIYYTTAEGPATVKIEQPANPSFIPIIKTVNNDSARQVDLTPFLNIIENKPANTVLPYGLRISSDKRISCYYEIQCRKNAASYTLSGKNALGYEFIIPAQNHYPNYPWCDPPAKNVFDIISTEDSTTIHIVPKADLIGHTANDTFSIVLNQGQTWSGRAAHSDSTSHLGGSFVFSDKPIAVTVTDDAVFYPNTEPKAYDIEGDQLTPRHLAGTEFIVRSMTWGESEPVRSSLLVYAYEDSTFVTYYDSASFSNPMINRGEHAEFLFPGPIPFITWQPAYITSSKPVLVYARTVMAGQQYYADSPQAASCIVPPVNNCSGSHRATVAYTPPFGGVQNYWDLFIFTKNGNQGSFSCNPWWMCPIVFSPVPGTNGEWLWGGSGCINCTPYENNIFTNSVGRFVLSAISYDFITDPEAYAKFSFFSDQTSLNLGTDRKICPGDSTLLDAGFGMNSYIWSTGKHTASIWVKTPGAYWVQAIDGTCTLSDTIVISYYWTNPVNLGPDTVLCSGDSVLLNAGHGRKWYLWNTGDTSQTIWAKNPGTYWVKVQDSHCIISDTVLISSMTSINLGPDRSICPGDSAQLNAGTGMTSYLWNTGASTQTIWAKNAGIYWVTVTTGVCVFSDSVMVSYKPAPTVNLGLDISICLGQTHTFDAGFCAGCTYQWANLTTSQMNIGNGQTYTTGIAATYMVMVTGSNSCYNCDTVQLFTNAGPVVTNNPPSKTICTGESTNIVLASSVPLTTFNWTASLTSGVVTGFSADSGLIINQVLINSTVTPGVVTYQITPKVGGCMGPPADYLVTVNPGDSVKISIAASANNICEGIPVTFTATATNGGANPVYQWKVNGIGVGGNSPVYAYTPLNGDIVTCSLTSSNLTCTSNNPAVSNQVIMVINANLPVIVVISPSQNPVCSNVPVTFTATPTNGGGAPQYQWKVNGVNVGINSPVYTYTPANGDLVICELTSSESCTLNNPVTSSPVIMVINSNLPVIVVISASANPVCAGSSVTFTATPTNGGPLPAYQWKVNGINVGTNSPIYTYNPVSGDVVICTLTSSLPCTSNNPASSNPVSISINSPPVVTFTACFDTITTVNAKPFKLKGGIPLGGTYSGPGVNPVSGIWNPASAGSGNITITYSYTNVALCSAIAHTHIFNFQFSIFNCGSPLNDIRDNQVYQTVQIGAQCWMAENLAYGTEIPDNIVQRDNCIPEKYSRLKSYVPHPTYYQWDELMQYDNTPALQGLCPPGWHIPTEAEWNQLFAVYNGPGFAGSQLLSTGFSGFNALVNGSRFQNSSWNFDNFAIHLWSSSAWGPLKAWAHAMNSAPDDHSVSTYPSSRSNAFSVRCIND